MKNSVGLSICFNAKKFKPRNKFFLSSSVKKLARCSSVNQQSSFNFSKPVELHFGYYCTFAFSGPLWHHTTKSSKISPYTWLLTEIPIFLVSSFSRCGAKVKNAAKVRSFFTQNFTKSTQNRCNEQTVQYFVKNVRL
jgi:hypothetical protein